MSVTGSVLELFRGDHSADLEWRLTIAEAEERLGRGEELWSRCVSFAGWRWGFLFARWDSGPRLRVLRYPVSSPAPLVRLRVGARTGDEGPEEEIGRGTANGYHRHFPLLSDFLSRWARSSAPSPDTVLSISLRLRTGPETDPETGGASGSVSRQRETTREDSEDDRILKEHLKKMLLQASDHDLTLRVQGKEFKAHKSVLRARSPVFEAMFKHPMRENEEDSVTVEDVDPECFGAFLAYIYTGEAEGLSAAHAMGLYYAADKYDFPALKRRCVDVLRASLSTTLVCDIVTLATTHGEEDLLESAVGYVTEHLVPIMETVEWQRFAVRNPIQANEVCLRAIKRRLPTSSKGNCKR